MKKSWRLASILLAVGGALAATGQTRLYDPYERAKNGPPLTNVFHKVEPAWLLAKLRNPKHHPAARMPDFQFTVEEALDILAYLKSIAGAALPPKIEWPTWAGKVDNEMNDNELDAMANVTAQGKSIWNSARCSICHTVNGSGGTLIGGFVDLRVGGIDLQIAGARLKRDWLFAWIREPKNYFPETLMPRYRLPEAEIKALVEFILRDEAFRPSTEPELLSSERWNALEQGNRVLRGKRLIELARCILCHDIQGIPELLPRPPLPRAAPAHSFQFLAYDLRCLSCHSIDGRGGTYAPDLTGVGSRLREDWIVRFVSSPDTIRPLSQQMPKFNLTSEEAQIIASYLSQQRQDTRIPPRIPSGPVSSSEARRGRETFRSRGCFACHSTGEGPGGTVGPDLAVAADRLWPGYIWFHLKNPHAVNPYSAEPDYGLADDEARALASYLAERKK